jgi:NAD-dependent SIR2 family protein deacetylase
MSNESNVLETSAFHQIIRDAWYSNRPIVPLIGAGFSADSGMPTLASIVRYIAKLKCYLRHSLYGPASCKELYGFNPNLYYNNPDQYLEAFGWPDRFQLNADVSDGLSQRSEIRRSKMFAEAASLLGENSSPLQLAIHEELNNLACIINPVGHKAFEKIQFATLMKRWLRLKQLADAQSKKKTKGDHAEFLKTLWNAANSRDALGEPQKMEDALAMLLQSLAEIGNPYHQYDSLLYQITGDWKPLLRHVSGFKQELIDALFARLAKDRVPSNSHIFLAHLTQLLNIKTIFTYNFDHLIEMALSKEEVPHRLFSMEHGSTLPSRVHLDENVAVIKMHGSTHNILVDERVDYKLTEQYHLSFKDLAGQNPLILIMGCSGGDRRLRDLLGGLLGESPKGATAVWMQRAESADAPSARILNLDDQSKSNLKTYKTYEIGQSLNSLFCALTNRYPPGRSPYRVKINIPDVIPEKETTTNWELVGNPRILIFPPSGESKAPSVTSVMLLETLRSLPLAYTRIWIDLEEFYSATQVIAEILDQMRKRDSNLYPFLASISKDNRQSATAQPETATREDVDSDMKRAARRVFRGLKRSRYVLAICGLDAFTWQVTTHHGVSRKQNQVSSEMAHERSLLVEFMDELIMLNEKNWKFGDSVLLFHSEYPYPRHNFPWPESPSEEKNRFETEQLAPWDELKAQLETHLSGGIAPYHRITLSESEWHPCLQNPQTLPRKDKEAPPLLFPILSEAKDLRPDEAGFVRSIGCMVLACHRRTRVAVGLQDVFDALVRSLKSVEDKSPKDDLIPLLRAVNGMPGFLRDRDRGTGNPFPHIRATESGIWFDRPLRDRIYDYNTRLTDEDRIADWIARDNQKKSDPKPLLHAAFTQLLIAATLHDLICRCYFFRLYIPSKDGFAFFEYAYHRISSLRYMLVLSNLINRLQDEDLRACTDPSSGQVADRTLSLFCRCFGTAFEEGWVDFLSLLSSEKGDRKTGMLAILHGIRERSIRGFTQAWRSNERDLRNSLSPDLLNLWCSTLIKFDFCTDDIESQTISSKVVDTSTTNRAEKNLVELVVQAIAAVGETQSRVNYERGDFNAFRTVRSDLAEKVKRLHRIQDSTNSSDLVRTLKSNGEVDSKVGEFWHQFFGASRHQAKYVKDAAKLSSSLKDAKKGVQKSTEESLRHSYIEIERYLASDSDIAPAIHKNKQMLVVSHSRFSVSAEGIDVCLDAIQRKIDHTQSESTDVTSIRNPLLEVTADRSLLVPYRSLFKILSARLRISKAMLSDSDRSEEAPWQQLFKEAFRDTSFAKEGMGDENAIVRAIAHLINAEACLKYYFKLINQPVAQDAKGSPTQHFLRQDLERSHAKLKSASVHLSRCYRDMLQAPRYALVWRYFHAIKASYHIEKLLILAGERHFLGSDPKPERSRRRTDPSDTPRRVGGLIYHIRQGLLAIQSILDERNMHDVRFPIHAEQLRVRLATASLALALLDFKTDHPDVISLKARLQLLVEQWWYLCRSEGVSPIPFIPSSIQSVTFQDQATQLHLRRWVDPDCQVCYLPLPPDFLSDPFGTSNTAVFKRDETQSELVNLWRMQLTQDFPRPEERKNLGIDDSGKFPRIDEIRLSSFVDGLLNCQKTLDYRQLHRAVMSGAAGRLIFPWNHVRKQS